MSVCLLVIAAATALIKLDLNQLASARTGTGSGTSSSQPNIIILGTDGLNADNMTIYGYERDTTPRIAELAQDSLVAENNFPNSSNSAGSVVSMLTSKLPTETHLVYAPDILTGANAYQHLPGVLKMAGYRAVEFGMPDYVDAYSFNMQYSFDEVNGISKGHTQISTYLQKLGYDNTDYFLNKLMGRVSERLKHIFYLEDMQNPYNIVTQRARGISDQEKITQMLEVIEQSPEPVFAHLHLLETHGAKFYPPIQEFSQGKQQDQGWMVDFYDDAVLSFDSYVGQVIDGLIKNGEYDNTILIINSDHAMQYQVNKRIPLIMHFPDDESAGRISQNVQNLDIAPTILDYLGMPVPEWMGGISILQGNLDNHRPIISAGTVKVTEDAQGLFTLDSQQVKPPFYQFSMVNVIDCQRWYQLDLTGLQWLSGEVENYVEPCVEDSMLSFDEIKQLVAQQLFQDGFDVSSLP
jgi:arylsulfatase A-like enzyme